MREIIISKSEDGEKLKKLCFKYFDKAPQSFTFKMLRKKNIKVNDKKAEPDAVLHAGDSVKFFLSDETIALFHTERAETPRPEKSVRKFRLNDSNIIYENDDYIIINKPAGVLSQKSDASDYSVNEAVIDYMIEAGDITEESLNVFRPSVCNRLDRNTSGIITAGKTLKGLRYLNDRLGSKDDSRVKKIYLTITHGHFNKDGIHELYYSKDEASNKALVTKTKESKSAVRIVTGFKLLSYNKARDLSLVECVLYTGKSHQIRVSLESLGFPVVGDIKYGDRLKDRNLKPRPKRQLLHAHKLILDDEQFTADIPEDFNGYMEFKGTQGLDL
jgi:23S rRNA pseudouridine955/2504/2580 synthase